MKNKRRILQVLSLLLVFTIVLVAGFRRKADVSATTASSASTDHWMTDFEKAKQTAREEDKDLLIDFAGSDWCYWCQRLDKEVFSKTAFLQEAGKQFVFVLLDFPNDKSGQTAEIQRQNERLARQFDVEGFPTVFLTDANGRPYARTGYMEGGAQTYLEHLRELRNQEATP
ncbi:MAG: thioredoxin family protein [Phycisphaerae bacterium]|nr:thioredoxin family protein [Phycisphaerae bacterium]